MPQPGAGNQKLFKNSFTAGELSPRMVGRTDLKEYYKGLETCENFKLLSHGGLKRREGTSFVHEVKTSGNDHGTILVPFAFSDQQEYILEFGDKYIRFYQNGAIILVAGNPLEVVTPYLFTQLGDLRFTQSADTLYIAHPLYQPRKLLRLTSTPTWELDVIDFIDGPYRDENLEVDAKLEVDATVNPASKTINGAADNGAGLIRIQTTAAHGYITGDAVRIQFVLGTTEANGYWIVTNIDATHFDLQGSVFTNAYVAGGKATKLSTMTASGIHPDGTDFAPFVAGASTWPNQSGHQGSLWRIKANAVYGYVYLAFVKDTKHAWVDIRGALDAASTPSSLWREGAWSFVRGFPSTNNINAQRLVWAANASEPQRMWASRSLSYENYTPGTTDSDAWTYQIGSNKVNTIRWMYSTSRGMIVGTIGEEFLAKGAGTSGDITPTSVDVKPQTPYGSNKVPPVRIGQYVYFVQPSGRKVRKLQYQFVNDTYDAEDAIWASEHLTGSDKLPIPLSTAMGWAPEPDNTLYAPRTDGQMLTHLIYTQAEASGWARYITGGYKDGTIEVIESVAVIHNTTKTRNEVWQIVARTINGVTKRYVEFYTPDLHTDSAQTADNTVTSATVAPGATSGNSVTFSANSSVFLSTMVGAYIMALPRNVNPGTALIVSVTNSSHAVANIAENFTSTGALTSGNWGFGFNNFAGVNHLSSRTVNLIGDGAVYPDVIVSPTGTVSVPAGHPPIVKVEIGLPFTAFAKTMRPDVGQGNSIMLEKKRWGWLKARVQDTMTMTINDNEVATRTTQDPLGEPVSAQTGDISLQGITEGWDFDAQITFRQDKPVDTHVNALFGRLEVGGGQDD